MKQLSKRNKIRYRKGSKRPDPPKKELYEVINGKPHFGFWFGKWVAIEDTGAKDYKENPYAMNFLEHFEKENIWDFEKRNIQVIFKPAIGFGWLNQVATIGVKFILWGRAYKVMKLTPSYKK